MPRLARVEIWTDYAPAGIRIAVIRDRASTVTTRDVAGDENVQIAVPRNSSANDDLAIGRVLRLLRRDTAGTETFDQWRISQSTRSSGLDASTYTYIAQSPLFDLAKGIVAQVLSTGETLHVFTVNGLTPAQILTTYALPALAVAGITCFSIGTMDSSAPLTNFTIEYMTPLALCQALRDQTGLELRARQNGGSGFFIDLLTQIGAGASRPTFRLTKNILSNQVVEQTTDQVTRCIPRGDRLPSQQEYHTIARIILKVTAVSVGGGSITLTVADPAGSIQPIGMDDEFNTWFVLRQLSGVTFPITATIATPQQQLVITSAASIGVGEYLELRSSDTQSQRVGIPPSAPANGPVVLPYVSAGDSIVPTRFVLTDAGAGSIDFVLFDGQYMDLFVTYCTQQVSDSAATVDGANGRFAFSVSIAAAAVGDLVYFLGSGATASPPHGLAMESILWRVTSLDVPNKYAYVQPHYANRASEVLPNLTPRRVVIIRRASTQQAKTSIAAGNKIELTATFGGGNVGKIALIEQWCAGVLPAYLDDPVASQAPPAGYGIIPRPLDKSGQRGEGNLIRNPLNAAWANPSSPPDGWSHDAASVAGSTTPEFSQNTDPTYIKYGLGASWDVTLIDQARSIATAPTSPAFYVNPSGFSDLARTVYKLSFYLGAFSGDAEIKIVVKTISPTGVPTQQFLASVFSTDTTATTDATKKWAANQWLDMMIPATDLFALFGDYARVSGGFQLQLLATGNSGFVAIAQVYFDAAAVYQISYDPGAGAYVDGSFANRLLDAGNRQLQANSLPSKEYTVKTVDLARIPNSPWPDEEITLGGQIDLRDTAMNRIDVPRVTRAVIDEDRVDNDELTLATLQSRLTTLLAGAAV